MDRMFFKDVGPYQMLVVGAVKLRGDPESLRPANMARAARKAAARHFRLSRGVDPKSNCFPAGERRVADLRLDVSVGEQTESDDAIARAMEAEFSKCFEPLKDADTPLLRLSVLPGSQKDEATAVFAMSHALGDGVSVLVFLRDFVSQLFVEPIEKDSDEREVCNNTPPPILDNLINPWFFQVLRALWSSIWDLGINISRGKRIPDLEQSLIGKQGPRCRNIVIDADLVDKFRAQCKSNKATMTSAVLTAALISCEAMAERRLRRQLGADSKAISSLLPTHHAWISTTDIRRAFLKPEESQIFANFAGSVTESAQKMDDQLGFFAIARDIAQKHRDGFSMSIERLGLLNYMFRRFSFFRKFVDAPQVADLAAPRKPRYWSVEFANMGRFDPPEGSRGSIEAVFGNVSPSFPGNLTLFSVGAVTVPSGMCVSATFDERWVTIDEGEQFVEGIRGVILGVCDKGGHGEISVGQILQTVESEPTLTATCDRSCTRRL